MDLQFDNRRTSHYDSPTLITTGILQLDKKINPGTDQVRENCGVTPLDSRAVLERTHRGEAIFTRRA
jgi:hypothetical protein